MDKVNEHGREHRIPVPITLPGEDDWVLDTPHIVLLKDKAQAATNAVKAVFPVSKVHEAMCLTHASIRWFSTNSNKFDNIRHKNPCITDLQHRYKILCHVNLVKEGRRLMLLKWVNTYKEPLVARDWDTSWGKDTLSRVENCQVHLTPLRCGIPCDNNALESGNARDKEAVFYKKVSLFEFVDTVATEIVRPTSKQDTRFEGRLKSRSFSRLNDAVYNMKYFAEIGAAETLDYKGFPTFLHLQFDYTDEANDIPDGSFLLASEQCIKEMRSISGVPPSVFASKKECRKWLGKPNCPDSWVNIFKRLIRRTEEMASDPFMTFDVFCGWSQCFHIIRPIVPDNGGAVERAIRYYVDWMGSINHFPILTPDEVVAKGRKGLVSCTCSSYLHYCFCKHTFCILKRRGIFKGYPPTMCPIPVNKRKRGGRTRNMVRGEALNRDG